MLDEVSVSHVDDPLPILHWTWRGKGCGLLTEYFVPSVLLSWCILDDTHHLRFYRALDHNAPRFVYVSLPHPLPRPTHCS